MPRVCAVTGKRTKSGHNVSHSNRKTKRTFKPNIFKKKVFVKKLGRFVTMKLSAKGLKILQKRGKIS